MRTESNITQILYLNYIRVTKSTWDEYLLTVAEVFLILRKVFYHVIRTRPGVLITGGHKCGYNHRWNNARPNLEQVCYESTLSSSRGPSGADREQLLEQQRVSYSTSRFKPDHLLDRHCLSLLNELQLLLVFQLLIFCSQCPEVTKNCLLMESWTDGTNSPFTFKLKHSGLVV